MFGSGKQKVTHEALASALYKFAVDFTKLMADRELNDSQSPYSGADREVFTHEWILIMFWVMHRIVIDSDKERLMGLILKNYFEETGLMQNKEDAIRERNLVIGRFKEYDSVFDQGAGTEQLLFGGTVAKNLLQRDDLIINAMVQFQTVTHVFLLMKEVKEIYGKYRVSG